MPVDLNQFLDVTITRASRTSSRRGFGTILIASYLTWMIDRVRTYAEPDEMIDDGCPDTAPEYLAAVALCAQEDRPDTFKIGRRAGAPDQTIRLTPSTPVEGEDFTFTIGDVTFTIEADSTPTVAEICAAMTLLINADTDAIIASGVASTTGTQSIDSGDFNGVLGDGTPVSPPRNLTFTFNSHADWDATTIVVTGPDTRGRTVTENISVPNGGNATVVGAQVFDLSDLDLLSFTIPAQSGTNGTLTVGVGALFENADLDITATDNTTSFSVSADDTGAWFALTDVTDNLAIADLTAEPGTTLATDLAAIQTADADWYGLIVADAQSAAQIEAVATWVESEKVFYCAHSMDADVANDVDTDIATTLKDDSRLRTKIFYSRGNHGAFPDAALLGRMFSDSFAPGSASFEFKSLSGISPDDYSTAVFERLVGTKTAPTAGKNAMIYTEVAATGSNDGEAVTLGGLMAGDEWCDIVRGLDWLNAELQSTAFDLQLSQPRVPYTAAGIDMFEGAVRTVLRRAAKAPYNLLDETSITTQATAVEDVPDADRQARYYDGVRFDARVQGAIRAVRFRGTVAA